MIGFMRGMRREAKLFASAIYHDALDKWLGQYFVLKPITLQLVANSVSDSEWATGGVAERAKNQEITLEEFCHLLSNPLFSKVQQAEIASSDGPTLRPDITELGRVLIDSLPKLKRLVISANALQAHFSIERAVRLAQIAQGTGVRFRISVSLDAFSDDYDLSQGGDENSVSAIDVINELRQNGLPVTVSYALTPLGCYGADDVLLWCEQNHIQDWIFHPVKIKSLSNYNGDDSQQFQFTPEQRFHTTMFFDKLAHVRRVDLARRMFYSSLVSQLAFGLPGQFRCDWKTRGITLDMRGNIGFCPGRRQVPVSALQKNAVEILKEGIPERKRIMREHCDSCLDDVTGSPSTRELVRRGADIVTKQWQRQWNMIHRRSGAPKSILPANHNDPHEWKHVLITGWYGTETTGDKAILGELLRFLKTYSPGCQVILTTIDRKVSQQTQLELEDHQDVSLVDIDKGDNPALIESVDAVIIGGGPLMEIHQMHSIWRMFIEANRQRKARIVFGCGVGPIYTEEMHRVTGAILRMTTAGFFRDQESFKYAQKHAMTDSLSYACDPALAFITRWFEHQSRAKSQVSHDLQIAGLLRANTNEFVTERTRAELEESNRLVARQIAHVLEYACDSSGAKANLLHMNAHWLGGDDRMFNRLIENSFSSPDSVHMERAYLSIEGLLRALHVADAAVAMRYHGHLFCLALGIPFLSIDYTGAAGKVQRLIRRIGYEQWSEDWRSMDTQRAGVRLATLLDERGYWSNYLQEQTDKLVGLLHQTYTDVFKLNERSVRRDE